MRIKVDEHLIGRTVKRLQSYGHEVHTVQEEGLAGADDQVVYAAALREELMLFTIDKDFSDIRRFRVGEHGGLIFLRLDDTRQATIDEAIDVLHKNYDLESLERLPCRGATTIPSYHSTLEVSHAKHGV